MVENNKSEIKYDPSWGIRPTPDTVEPMTTYEMFLKSVSMYPDKTALIFMDKKITYRELDSMVRSYAASLKKLGIQKGDRIGALLPNCPQHVIAFLATIQLGAIHVPANVMYTGDEILYIFRDAGVCMVITLDLFYPVLMSIKSSLNIEKVIVSGIDDFLPAPVNFLYRIKSRLDGSHVNVTYDSTTLKLKDLLREKGDIPVPSPGFDFDDTMLILYTAGTTGKSKGVMLTHRNFVYNAANQSENFDVNENEVNLVLFPMFHISGYLLFTICMFYCGGTTILEPRFVPGRYLKIFDKYRVTIFFAPPTVYIAFMNEPGFEKYDLSAFRICGASGAPVPLEVQKKWKGYTGLDLLNGYGLTETTAGAVVSLPNKYNLDAIGVPMGGELRIVDRDGNVVPLGEHGEIWFRGDQNAKGYWKMPEETAKCFENGWLKTGDIAYMDGEGFIYFVDREKDIIIASAYNISPAEVEGILLKHDAVKEAGVIGVPDEYRGETVKAYITLKDEYRGRISEDEIIAWSKENMAAYKYPRLVEFIDELPKSPIQKILRKELRKLHEQTSTKSTSG